MIEVDKIFSLFPEIEEQENPTLLDFTQDPIYFIKMFTKLISEYSVLYRKLINTLEKQNTTIDKNDIEKAGRFLSFNKAYKYISNLDLKDEITLNILHGKIALKDFNIFIENLEKSIDYFILWEEYEKCAFLQKILTEIQSKFGTPKKDS